MAHSLKALHEAGQSVWLDFVSRGLLRSGALRRLIDDGVSGLTSNPTIFDKAISGSGDYDEAIRRLGEDDHTPDAIVDQLIIEDIQAAANLFRPLYESTQGGDGYVSIEVTPRFAHDTEATMAEARRLSATVGRPNVMVKIPGTREGLPAIRQMIAEGRNINVTLLFAIDRYEQVIEAYLGGLEERVRQGKPIDRVASVASFFVSRVDTAVDAILDAKLKRATEAGARTALQALVGQAAIANAAQAYQRFTEQFRSERFQRLRAQGARVQRVLWASTSTKNPQYRDVRYVEELIGPDTINTMPESTITAFTDHGRVERTLERHVAAADAVLRALADHGVDMGAVTKQLEVAGVNAFVESFDALLRSVAAKRQLLAA